MKLKKNLLMIRDAFSVIPLPEKRKPRVAIVGEIYVKYSPYANNNLTEFLEKQNCEVVYPSLSEFVLYCIYNMMEDYRRYGMKWLTAKVAGMLYKHFLKQTRVMNSLIKEKGYFPYEDFEYVVKQGERIINTGVKMGEGWLIPAEMLAYSQNGVHNIVCAQPFGCLPNHIVGKGMVRPLKEIDPSINIVPLDFDASSTQVNQENRLKLMLANLK
jgi:predicted nucleotide-binding protein (sugar kinase/HSP70/actin superfamily)